MRRGYLDFDTGPFSYMVLDAAERPLFVVYSQAPTRSAAGHLASLLKEVRDLAGAELNVRSVVWLPAYLQATTFVVAIH